MKLLINLKLKVALLCSLAAAALIQGAHAQTIDYSGNSEAVNWGVGAAAFGSEDIYSNDMIVNVNGDSQFTLTTNVAPTDFNVTAGTTIIGSAEGTNYTLEGAVDIAEGARLKLDGARITNSTDLTGTGVFEYTAGDQVNISSAMSGFEGDFILNGGAVRFEGVPANLDSMTINAGALLRLHGGSVLNAGTELSMNGSLEEGGAFAVLSFSQNTGARAMLNASGNVELSTTYDTGTLYAGIAGTGTVKKSGNDTLTILGDSTHTGTLNLTAGTTNIGNGDSTLDSVDFSVININDNVTLHLNKASLDAATRIKGTGRVDLTLNDVNDYNASKFLSEFSGDVYMNTGVRFARDTDVSSDATLHVSAGNRLRIDGVGISSKLVLKGAETLDGPEAELSIGNINLNAGEITATGEVMLNPSWAATLNINNGLTGSGNIDATIGGSSAIVLQSDATHTGDLSISGGTFHLGNTSAKQVSVDFGNINVNSGATLTINTGSALGLGYTTINLKGGTLNHHDTTQYESNGVVDYSKAVNIGKIIVEQDSTIQNKWKGLYAVEELTGNANLTFSGDSSERFTVSATIIKDYNGTVDLAGNANRDLELKQIDQAAGNTVILKGDVDGIEAKSGLTKLGAGDATIESALAITGSGLDVHAGNLNLEAATTVADGIKGSGGSAINLKNDIASLSIVGAIYTMYGTATGGTITGTASYYFDSDSIANATLTGMDIRVASGTTLTLNNVIIDASSKIQLSEGASVQLQKSELTSLNVADNGLISFTTGEKTFAEDVQSYTITDLGAVLGGAKADGTLTLNLGEISGELAGFVAPSDSGDMVAFILSDVADLGDILKSGWYNDIELLIGNKSYAVMGAVDYAGGGVLLYIPEPSTATLSLLALAGLLARRRRKTV